MRAGRRLLLQLCHDVFAAIAVGAALALLLNLLRA